MRTEGGATVREGTTKCRMPLSNVALIPSMSASLGSIITSEVLAFVFVTLLVGSVCFADMRNVLYGKDVSVWASMDMIISDLVKPWNGKSSSYPASVRSKTGPTCVQSRNKWSENGLVFARNANSFSMFWKKLQNILMCA